METLWEGTCWRSQNKPVADKKPGVTPSSLNGGFTQSSRRAPCTGTALQEAGLQPLSCCCSRSLHPPAALHLVRLGSCWTLARIILCLSGGQHFPLPKEALAEQEEGRALISAAWLPGLAFEVCFAPLSHESLFASPWKEGGSSPVLEGGEEKLACPGLSSP